MRLRVLTCEMGWFVGDVPLMLFGCSSDPMPCCDSTRVSLWCSDLNIVECDCGAGWDPDDLGVIVGPDGKETAMPMSWYA
jgi:hypothetical protein